MMSSDGEGKGEVQEKEATAKLAKQQPWIGRELMAIGNAGMAREWLIEATR